MAKSVTEMSLAELEKALSSRKSKLEKLQTQRKQLLKQLAGIDSKIRGIAGSEAVEKAPGVKVVRKRRPKNKQPLKAYVLDILGRSKKGLTLDEVHTKVLASGYKTKSDNFKNVVYQCLYHAKDISQDSETGRYQLKS